MEITLKTETTFDAAHKLNNYKGKCANLHGHRWLVKIKVKGDDSQLNKAGLLWDFSNRKQLRDLFDHKVLNQILKVNPTAENIALFTFKKFKKQNPCLFFEVEIFESPTSSAIVGDIEKLL